MLVGARDARDRPGLLAVPGGADGLRRVLADQLRLRRRRALPEPVGQSGWTVEATREEHQGHAGPGRAVRAGRRARRVRWAAAGRRPRRRGLDRGHVRLRRRRADDASPPRAGGVRAGPVRRAAPVARLLDLRSGVVHERSGSGSSAVASVRFLALDRPTTAAVRAEVPAGHRTGRRCGRRTMPPIVESGVLDGTRWMRVTGTTGGIAAAGVQSRTVRRDGDRRTRRRLGRSSTAWWPSGPGATRLRRPGRGRRRSRPGGGTSASTGCWPPIAGRGPIAGSTPT